MAADHNRHLKEERIRGFTLVELLVSISIATVIMAVVLFNYAGSSDSLAVTAAGNEMAVAIRQAQAYGLSVKESAVSSGAFGYAYGVYVSPSANPSDYVIFVDKNGNRTYDAGTGSCGSSTTECVERDSLRNGITITSIQDSTGSTPSGATGVSISFLRPNTDAAIKFTNSGGTVVSTASKGKINLSSPRGKTYSVTVENSGQILTQ